MRQHAVVALSKLQDADEAIDGGSDAEDSDDEREEEAKRSVADVLIDVLNHDPAA